MNIFLKLKYALLVNWTLDKIVKICEIIFEERKLQNYESLKIIRLRTSILYMSCFSTNITLLTVVHVITIVPKTKR